MNLLEKGIWNRIREGDLNAFEVLFNTYFKGLRVYAQDFLKNREDAEEIVLDMFSLIWENKKAIEIHTSIKGYLYKGIHNRCINHLHNNTVTQKKEVDYTTDVIRKADQEMMMNEATVLDNLIVLEIEDEIKIAIGRLPDQCREIFCLSRFEQMKIHEIAVKLNLAESTVKTQLGRAIGKLHDILIKHLG